MQSKNSAESFDFEYWAALARKNPEAFESMRQKCLEALIEQAPEHSKQRMRGLQWQIDQTRARSANPMAACLNISKMMWESVTGEGGLLEALEQPDKLLKAKIGTGQNNVIKLHPEG